MSWYKEHKQEWKEIIETISREVNRTPQMIEKDTIQSMFLLELSKTELTWISSTIRNEERLYRVRF